MDKLHEISYITFEKNVMVIKIDGKEHRFDLNEISTRLLNATQQEREIYQISPSGYGIHWHLIDEDLSIDGLLGIQHQSPIMQPK